MTAQLSYSILVLPGDHVGPEVIHQAVLVINQIQSLVPALSINLSFDEFGGCSIDKHGVPITESVLAKAAASDAVLFGAVGGPEWDNHSERPETGVLKLRKTLNCWANIRPCKFPSESLIHRSVLKPEVVKGTDFVVLRENCGGAYFGDKVETAQYASDTWGYSAEEVRRITRMAAYLAETHGNNRIISCDKFNVLAVSRLWRRTVTETCKEFPNISLTHQLADSATVIMMQRPTTFNGVLLCDNTFGDMLSDESAVIVGSLGLLPSASLSAVPGSGERGSALYEPSHGSAPDLPKNVVNPIATILSVALMFRYTMERDDIAQAIEIAVRTVLDDKSLGGLEVRTKDLGGTASTEEIGEAIRSVLKEELKTIASLDE
jgi:3-isopropylmalate dehydrogenase